MTESIAAGEVPDREPIEVRAVSSAWTLERTARRDCNVMPSRAPYLSSRYPFIYAMDFVRGFLAAVPAMVTQRAMIEIVICNYTQVRLSHPALALGALQREWPPTTRLAAVRVLAAWARVEDRDYVEVCRAAADAFLALHQIDRGKPVDVPPGFEPEDSFAGAANAMRDMGAAFRRTGWGVNTSNGATYLNFG